MKRLYFDNLKVGDVFKTSKGALQYRKVSDFLAVCVSENNPYEGEEKIYFERNCKVVEV